jgi:hypothetical protein
MAYQFTFHAIQRCKDRGLTPREARDQFEKALRVKFKNASRKFYKLQKYGEEAFKTEYYYSNGYVFVCHRQNEKFSMILTIFKGSMSDLIPFYDYDRDNKKQ